MADNTSLQTGSQSPSQGAALGLLGFALYSTHDVIIKYLGGFYTPFQIIFFAVLFSFPLVTLYMLRSPKTGSLWPHHPVKMLIRVCSTTIVGFGAFYAFSVLPLAQVYALLFLTPIVVTILSVPILGERVGLHRIAAIIVGFIGVIIVLQPSVDALSWGHLTGLIAVLGGATNTLITRQIGQREKMSVMLLYPMLGNFLIMGLILPFVYVPMPLAHLQAIGLISILGFLAMMCLISAFQRSDAAIISPMQYSQIIWAGLFGVLVFDEAVTTSLLIGSTLIIASAVYIIQRERVKAQSLKPVLTDITSRPETGLRPRYSLLGRKAPPSDSPSA